MRREEQDKYRSLLASFLLHLVLLAGLSLTGIFAIVTAAEEKPVDVMIYEEDAGQKAGGGSAAAEAPAAAPLLTGDIAAIPEKVPLPAIHEEYTKSPEKQQAYKKEHGVVENPSSSSGAAQGSTDGSQSGTSQGSGNGSGDGPGNASGHGNDGGDGNGDGKDAGNARDPATAARAAVAPVLQSRPAPVYPEDLRAQNVEGTVVVSIIVGTDGGVDSASIVSSSGYRGLDSAALSAVQTSRYTPALNAYGERVRFDKAVRLPFSLTN